MLAEGQLSHRQIACLTGVGRTTIGKLARGKLPSHERLLMVALEGPDSAAPARRCPGCGGLVHPPCQLCHVRRIRGQPKAGVPILSKDR